jgi:glutathionylspermidine synthase
MEAIKKMTDYNIKRQKLWENQGNFWHRDDNGREFALADHIEIKSEVVNELRFAATELGKIFFKVARYLRQQEDISYLGMPQNAEKFAKQVIPGFSETTIGRFDFAVGPQGIKMLEFNADTPTFIVESFRMNSVYAMGYNIKDPNRGQATKLYCALYNAIKAGAMYVGKDLQKAGVYFTSFGGHKEDEGTARFLKSLADWGSFKSRYIPLNEIQIDEQGLWDQEGERIHVLYRLYPIEYLAKDVDVNGRNIGEMMMKLVEEKKLAIINPPSAFLMQSKIFQAVIQELWLDDFFTDEEDTIIQKYLLNSHYDPDELIGDVYVEKPAFGREGSNVKIHFPDGVSINGEDDYSGQPLLYQEYVELSHHFVNTENGKRRFNAIFTCFLIDGEASAIGCRGDGGMITSNMSQFIPLVEVD